MKNRRLYLLGLLLAAFAAFVSCKQKSVKKISFDSEGVKLIGNLYYPKNFDSAKKYPAVVVSGSWTTVKEQMAGLYAKKFAEKGFLALAFDFRNFGESGGEPRFYESPALKKEDLKNAVTYLQALPEVAADKITAFGVCAGAMYTLMAASEDSRIKSVATAASWLHDDEAVKLFYGGKKGVDQKIEAARKAKKQYAKTGEVAYVPAISKTDKSAAMYGPYDYYLNPKRGAIQEWSADKFAVMSWEDWLEAKPMSTAKKLKTPTLMIHSDGAVLPDYTKKYFKEISTSKKKLHWIKSTVKPPFEQFDFYDNEKKVELSVELASSWFQEL